VEGTQLPHRLMSQGPSFAADEVFEVRTSDGLKPMHLPGSSLSEIMMRRGVLMWRRFE